jgi:hypothetical protein
VIPTRDTLVDLLELQRFDSAIDRLTARMRHLPEQGELERLEEQLSRLESVIGEQQAMVDDIAARQRRLDHDIELLTAKVKAEEAKLYSGSIANPKELTDIQREVESIRRRISGLEDDDLEVMEEREGAEARLRVLLDEAATLRVRIEQARVARDEAAGDVAEKLDVAKREQLDWRPKFDAELLSLYDSIRAAKGGVGVAALIGGVCQGCHMRLPAQEVERIRQATGLVRCDECRRLLVVRD